MRLRLTADGKMRSHIKPATDNLKCGHLCGSCPLAGFDRHKSSPTYGKFLDCMGRRT